MHLPPPPPPSLYLYLIFLCIVATCPDLGNTIENGNVSYTRDPTEQGRYVENTTVTVSCDEGYRGGGVITCQNDGNWSSSHLPKCTSEPYIHGIASPTLHELLKVYTCTCDVLYVLKRNTESVVYNHLLK